MPCWHETVTFAAANNEEARARERGAQRAAGGLHVRRAACARTRLAHELQLHHTGGGVDREQLADGADRLALELRVVDVLGGDAYGRRHDPDAPRAPKDGPDLERRAGVGARQWAADARDERERRTAS